MTDQKIVHRTCSICRTQINYVDDINKYATINEEQLIGMCCNDKEDGHFMDLEGLHLTHEEIDNWDFDELYEYMYHGEGVEL